MIPWLLKEERSKKKKIEFNYEIVGSFKEQVTSIPKNGYIKTIVQISQQKKKKIKSECEAQNNDMGFTW